MARMTFAEITEQVARAEAAKHIWNVDYVMIKEALDRIVDPGYTAKAQELSARFLFDQCREALGMPWSYVSGSHDLISAVKKVEKYKKDMQDNPAAMAFMVVAVPLRDMSLRLKALKPFIEKGRKPSENPPVDPRTLEHTGTCGCCGRNVKLTANDVIWTHGYECPYRYGGGRTSDCFGTGYEPIEVSSKVWVAMVEDWTKYLATLPDKIASSEKWISENLDPKTQEERKTLGYAKEGLRQMRYSLQTLPGKITEYKQKIKTWKPRPLPDAK